MENITFSRKELYDLVWVTPMLSLSKKYDISDVGLRKICVRMDIPLPKVGHWQKLQFNKKSPAKQLPKEYKGVGTVTLKIREEGQVTNSKRRVLTNLQKEIETDSNLDMKVPDKLTKPDKLVIAARDNLKERSKYLDHGLTSCSFDHLSIRVSPYNIGRALRFMDKLIKTLRSRGHEIYVKHDSTVAIVEKEEIMISLRETIKREFIVDNKYSWRTAKDTPTGLLCFKMGRYGDKEWKDSKLTLEEQLPQIIARLEIEGKELRERTLRWEKQRAEDKEKKRIAKELEQRQEQELSNFKAILKEASRLHQATVMRNYLDKVEAYAIENNNLTDKLKEWLAWARKKADWYDPLIEIEDELLSNVDRDTLILQKKSPYSW